MTTYVNVNTADVEELMTVRHVGKVTAEAIVQLREDRDLPLELEDLQQIPSLSAHWRPLTETKALIFDDNQKPPVQHVRGEHGESLHDLVLELLNRQQFLEGQVQALIDDQRRGQDDIVRQQGKLQCLQEQ